MNAFESTSEPVQEGSALGINTSEILHAIIRRKWLILSSAIAVGVAVAAGTMRQPKIYEAVADLTIDPVLPKVLGDNTAFDTVSELARTERTFYNTQFEIIHSKMILRRAVEAIDLAKDDDFLRAYELADKKGTNGLNERIVDILNNQINVKPHLDSRVIGIVVDDFDPQRAARIANAIAQTYMDFSLEGRLVTTRGASNWLDQRVSEFGQKLEGAEKALYDFRKENTLISISLEDRLNMSATKLSSLNQELVKLETEEIELEAKREAVQHEAEERDGNLEALPKVVDNAAIGHFKALLADLRKTRAELSTRYGPLHQNMVAINRQMDEVTNELNHEIQVVVRSIDNELRTLKLTEKSVREAIALEKNRALDLNELSLQYSKLSRDFGTTKTIYESLLKRHAEADLSGRYDANFVHWFEPAAAIPTAVRPSVPKNTGIGLFVGLMLGLLIAVGGVLLDNTVHTQQDVEQTLGLTFLGILPSIIKDKEDQIAPVGAGAEPSYRDLYIVQNPTSSVAECARSIRTNLLFMGTGRPLKRLLVTSPGPVEGKSTIGINLSVAMAQAGNRVLIVDTDLRRPRLHRTFGVSGEEGLTSVLLEAKKLEDVIKSTEVVGLDLLPCGPLPPNPAELLHTERFAKLMEDLDARYDRVVFDSPPTNAVTDAVILAQAVHGVLLVVKASKTAKEAARRARRQLLSVNANLLGCVLNDLDLHSEGYGRYYQYYYRRYYGQEKAEA